MKCNEFLSSKKSRSVYIYIYIVPFKCFGTLLKKRFFPFILIEKQQMIEKCNIFTKIINFLFLVVVGV
jgi:hypothetical protein